MKGWRVLGGDAYEESGGDTADDMDDMPRPILKPVVEEEDEVQITERVLLYELWPDTGVTVCHVIALVVVLYLALRALS